MTRTLTFAHSPDADDAYLFYGFAAGAVTIDGCAMEHHLDEIELLNQYAEEGKYEITAVSAHAWPFLADEYAILSAGGSVARGYGPALVANRPIKPSELEGARVAVPGMKTTACLLAKLFLPEFEAVATPFDEVEEQVRAGAVAAGILIHEGQIEVERRGFHPVMDLGVAFSEKTGCPLPLGLDVVRRDLGEALMQNIATGLRDSIVYARTNHSDAIDYALPYGRGIDRDTADRFIRMYVNDDTVDMPDDAIRGLEALYAMGAERGLVPEVKELGIIRAR